MIHKLRTARSAATAGDRTKLAKRFVREEPCKRSQHYRKGVKVTLSRTCRRLDQEVLQEGLDDHRKSAQCSGIREVSEEIDVDPSSTK